MRHNQATSIVRTLGLLLVIGVLLVSNLLLPLAVQAQSPAWQFEAGGYVHSAAVSADGQAIVIGSRDGKVHRLDHEGNEVWQFDTGGTVLGLDMSQDGSRIIAASENRKATLLDDDGSVLWQQDFDYVLNGAAIAGDGSWFGVVPDRAKQAWFFDGDGNPLWEVTYTVIPTAIAIAADGEHAAVGLRDARVHYYDRQGAEIWKQQMKGVIRGLDISNDGSFLVTGDEQQQAYGLAAEIPAGARNSIEWTIQMEGKLLSAATTGDGLLSAFGARDKNVYLVDETGAVTSKFATGGQVFAVALSADGSTLVAGSEDGSVYGFSTGQSAAGYAAGLAQARLRMILIPLAVVAVIGAAVLWLGKTTTGQQVWEKQGAGPRRLMREIWRARLSYMLLIPTVGLLLVFNYYPAFSGLFHSFTKWNPGLRTEWVGLANFEAVLNNQFLRQGVINALILIVTGYIKTLTMPLLVAELLFHLRSSRIQYWLRSLFIFPIIVPGVAIILIWRNIFDPNIGLLNNVLAAFGLMNMRTPQAWLGDPQTAIWSIVFIGFPWVGAFALLLYYGGLISIPTELFDAAKVDGASGWRRFWMIDLPLLMGQIKLLLVLGFIGGMQEFSIVFLTTEGGPYNATYTPALELYYQAMRFNNFGLASAIGTVLFLVIMVGTIINLKFVRSATEFQA
jgi:ABC-type sugar transport system permease subunit